MLMLVKPRLCIKRVKLNTFWLAPLVCAILLVCFFISPKDVWNGLMSSTAINPIKILILFLSMTILSIFLDEVGFFKYLASAVVRKTGTNQFKLFTALFITVSIVTVFTSNDVVILTFTPFVCYFAKNAGINPVPYLVAQFVAANTASMLFIIGNPTNIYLATTSGITFLQYLKVMALPTIFAIIVAYVVMLLLFWKKLRKPMTKPTGEKVVIENKPLLIIGIVWLALCTVFIVISSYINFEMWIVAAVAVICLAVSVLIFILAKRKGARELGHTLKRTPWDLIPFVISMFVLVIALEQYNVTEKLASLFGESNPVITYGIASTLLSNLVNNIPMSVLFSSILSNLTSAVALPGVYAAIIGSNIGAFLTPLGALAGIMWLSILRDNNVKFNFLSFVKYGFLIAIPVLFAALLGLFLVV